MKMNPSAEPGQSNYFDAGSRRCYGPSIVLDVNRHRSKFGSYEQPYTPPYRSPMAVPAGFIGFSGLFPHNVDTWEKD